MPVGYKFNCWSRIREEEALVSASQSSHVWEKSPDQPEAICYSAWMCHPTRLVREVPSLHDVEGKSACGYHGVPSLREMWKYYQQCWADIMSARTWWLDILGHIPPSEPQWVGNWIMMLVEGWGKVIMGSHGWASQNIKVHGIVCIHQEAKEVSNLFYLDGDWEGAGLEYKKQLHYGRECYCEYASEWLQVPILSVLQGERLARLLRKQEIAFVEE